MEALGGQEVGLDGADAAEIGRGEIRGAKSLPQVWFRIESPLLRRRQFAGLDVYGFGEDGAAIRASFRRILERCGVESVQVEDGFLTLLESGTDAAVVCPGCGYTASPRTAWSAAASPAVGDPEGDLTPEEFHTPGQKTIADIARFTGLPESAQMKSLVLVANQKPVLVMLRGDHQLNEARFAAKTGDAGFRQATAGGIVPVVRRAGGVARPGRGEGHADSRGHCAGRTAEYDQRREQDGLPSAARHAGRGFRGGVLRSARGDGGRWMRALRRGSGIPQCGGTGADECGRVPACATERILTTAVEMGNDKDGMMLPAGIAPFDVVVSVAVATDVAQMEAAERIYRECAAAGLEPCWTIAMSVRG